MISNLYEIRRQLSDSKHGLLHLKNVVATGIGYKIIAGEDTSDLAIICSVEVKKPKNRISAGELVPPVIRNIPTDVQSVGQIHAFQLPKGRFRPVPGGVSTGHFLVSSGTLGCLVKKNGVSYILSNNHVLANCNKASIHDPILQPGPDDGGKNPADQIAELSEYIPLHFLEKDMHDEHGNKLIKWIANFLKNIISRNKKSSKVRNGQHEPAAENLVDCAIARPLEPENVIHKIRGMGLIQSVRAGELGMQISKSGRTTGLTRGVIKQIEVSARVNYGKNRTALFTDQLVAAPMSCYGDSGSVVLDENNNLIGLLFAGSEKITLINRIENVFDALAIKLV